MRTEATISKDSYGKLHLNWDGPADRTEVSRAVLADMVRELNNARGLGPKVVGAWNISPYDTDVEVYYHPNLESAEAGRDSDAYLTLVRYNDGTVEVAWMSPDVPVVVS